MNIYLALEQYSIACRLLFENLLGKIYILRVLGKSVNVDCGNEQAITRGPVFSCSPLCRAHVKFL